MWRLQVIDPYPSLMMGCQKIGNRFFQDARHLTLPYQTDHNCLDTVPVLWILPTSSLQTSDHVVSNAIFVAIPD